MQKVSVIIPAYNKADLTVQTVNSVLAQTYKNVEIIVVDDGSTDDTAHKLSIFGDKIKYLLKKNGGACSARNAGLRKASGEFIAFLDCDDLYHPTKIERSVDYLNKHPEFGFVHTGVNWIDNDGKKVGTNIDKRSRKEGWIADRLIYGNFLCNPTIVARQQFVRSIGGFDESMFAPADWDFWLKLAEKCQAGFISEALTDYRITDNYTFKHIERVIDEERRVIGNFFKRNSLAAQKCDTKKVMANFHFRYALCFFIKKNTEKFNEHLNSALKLMPLNLKFIAVRLASITMPTQLHKMLSKHVLRT